MFKTLQSIKMIAVLTAVLVVGATATPNSTQAGVIDHLVDAANGALAVYGRDDVYAYRLDLTTDEISAGLREVLKVSADNTVLRLSGGGYRDTAVRVELPRSFRHAQKISARIGFAAEFDLFEEKLNKAAVAAAPATRDVVHQILDSIKFDDPRNLLNGSQESLAEHFRVQVNDRIILQLGPFMDDLLVQVGALESRNKIIKRIGHLPMIKHLETDLVDYVAGESLNGFFYYLAKEEQAIRLNPEYHTTELLRKVFGS